MASYFKLCINFNIDINFCLERTLRHHLVCSFTSIKDHSHHFGTRKLILFLKHQRKRDFTIFWIYKLLDWVKQDHSILILGTVVQQNGEPADLLLGRLSSLQNWEDELPLPRSCPVCCNISRHDTALDLLDVPSRS